MEGPEIPELPSALPKLDRKRLWWSLLLLPGLAAMAGLALGLAAGDGIMDSIPHLEMLTAVVSYGLGSACWWVFARTILARYRGRSAVLLIVAFPIAQSAICLALFFGTCLGAYYLIEEGFP